jgi:hypothetical protein
MTKTRVSPNRPAPAVAGGHPMAPAPKAPMPASRTPRKQALASRAAKPEPATVRRRDKAFDYSALKGTQRTKVEKHTENIHRCLKASVLDLLNLGTCLIEVKQILPHGQFGPWLEVEFGLSPSTAKNMMRAAERFKSTNFVDLNIAPSALYLLAAPSTPPEIAGKFIKRAVNGRAVTHGEVKKEVDAYKKVAQKKKTAVAESEPEAEESTTAGETPASEPTADSEEAGDDEFFDGESEEETAATEEPSDPEEAGDDEFAEGAADEPAAAVDDANATAEGLRSSMVHLITLIDDAIIDQPGVGEELPERDEICSLIDQLQRKLSKSKTIISTTSEE